jgi:hypothetical protein
MTQQLFTLGISVASEAAMQVPYHDISRKHICRPDHAALTVFGLDSSSFSHEIGSSEGFDRPLGQDLLRQSQIVIAQQLRMRGVKVEQRDIRKPDLSWYTSLKGRQTTYVFLRRSQKLMTPLSPSSEL